MGAPGPRAGTWPPLSSFSPEHMALVCLSLRKRRSWEMARRIELLADGVLYPIEAHCCCSVAKLCPTLCNPMNCSTPGFPALQYLLEFAQTHVHRVSGAIQPSQPLSPPSPPAFSLPQHQSLFQCVHSSHQVAKVVGISALASVFP